MALSHKHLLVVSIGIAAQAAVMVLLNAYVPKLCHGMDMMWIAFQAWAVYFLAGCNPKAGAKAWVGYLSGIIASILIIKLMGVPGISKISANVGGMNVLMAVAVFIIVIPAIMTENVKNFVPGLFIGSGAFFATLGSKALEAALPEAASQNTAFLYAAQAELVYALFGLVFGYITVFWRGKYEASLAKKNT